MAQLPNTDYLVQMVGEYVTLFNRHSERDLVTAWVSSTNEMAIAQNTIHHLAELSDEDKCFAHFWFGYFYAFAPDTRMDK